MTKQKPSGSFPQPKRVMLAESIADSIAQAVATHHLGSGERIVETALAERFSVSRVPVREALKILHTQGILTGGGHRGFRVASFTPRKAMQVSEVRLMLETVLLRDAIENWRAGTADLAALDRCIEEMRRACAEKSHRAILASDLNFHRAISLASGNEVAAAMWEAIARHVLIIFNVARYQDIKLTVVVRRHEKLREFIVEQIANSCEDAVLRKALEEHFLAGRNAGSGCSIN